MRDSLFTIKQQLPSWCRGARLGHGWYEDHEGLKLDIKDEDNGKEMDKESN